MLFTYRPCGKALSQHPPLHSCDGLAAAQLREKGRGGTKAVVTRSQEDPNTSARTHHTAQLCDDVQSRSAQERWHASGGRRVSQLMSSSLSGTTAKICAPFSSFTSVSSHKHIDLFLMCARHECQCHYQRSEVINTRANKQPALIFIMSALSLVTH